MARMRHRLEMLGCLGSCPTLGRFPTLVMVSVGEVSWENAHFCPSLCRSYLVPSYSFGENDVHKQEAYLEGTCIKILQNACKKFLGLYFCVFHGRGLTRESWGFLPFNRPITTVGELSVSLNHTGPGFPPPTSHTSSPRRPMEHSWDRQWEFYWVWWGAWWGGQLNR